MVKTSTYTKQDMGSVFVVLVQQPDLSLKETFNKQILGQQYKFALAKPLHKDLVVMPAIKFAIYSRSMVRDRSSLEKLKNSL